MCVHVEAKGPHWLSPSISLHFIFSPYILKQGLYTGPDQFGCSLASTKGLLVCFSRAGIAVLYHHAPFSPWVLEIEPDPHSCERGA